MTRRRYVIVAVRRHRPSVLTAAAVLAALILRLALPVQLLASPALDLAALGEHALCLSGASAGDATPVGPRDKSPVDPSGHPDHDSGCCKWHVAGGVILSGTGPVLRIAHASRVDQPRINEQPRENRIEGAVWARGPPAA